MTDRDEVEALLAACEPGSETFVEAMDKLSRRKVAALCRAWLAAEDAPARDVVGQQWDDVSAREGNVVWCSDLHPGQRVRIVPLRGDENGGVVRVSAIRGEFVGHPRRCP